MDEEITSPTKTIIALGDSLTEGYQLSQEESYPSQLEDLLKTNGYTDYKVVNAGISGDTSLGVLNRKEWIAGQSPEIVILVIGANDALRGFNLIETESNIAKTIEFFQEKKIQVLLGGMQITENLGKEYIEAFQDLYPELQERFQVAYIPFFLGGVAGVEELNLSDRIHPNVDGYRYIVEKNIWPYLESMLTKENSFL